MVSDIITGLSDYSDHQTRLTREDLEEDEQTEIPSERFEGDYLLDPLQKFKADTASVYVFGSPKASNSPGIKP